MPPVQDTAHFILVEFVHGPYDGERQVFALPSGRATDSPRIINVPMYGGRVMALYDPATDPGPFEPIRIGEYHRQTCVVNTVTAAVARLASSADLAAILTEKGAPSLYEWRGEF